MYVCMHACMYVWVHHCLGAAGGTKKSVYKPFGLFKNHDVSL